MKFKYLIVAFSIIAFIAILFTVLLPMLIEKTDFSILNFRSLIIPFLVIMGLILASVSTFFFLNYRLLSLLEREDWPALAYYLEQKIYGRKRYNSRYVRLLASSYLVISDFQSVVKLEGKVQLAKPSVVSKHALIFGSARVLSCDHGQAAAFFKSQLDKSKGKSHQWVRWYHSFCHLLAGDFNTVEPEFSSLAVSSNNAIITGLSAYFLQHSLKKYSFKPDECKNIAETGRNRVLKAIKNLNNWEKEVGKYGMDIYVAIIKKYINEAGAWIFNNEEPVTPVENRIRGASPQYEAAVEKPADDNIGEKRAGERRKGDRRAEKRYTSDRRTGDRRSSRQNHSGGKDDL